MCFGFMEFRSFECGNVLSYYVRFVMLMESGPFDSVSRTNRTIDGGHSHWNHNFFYFMCLIKLVVCYFIGSLRRYVNAVQRIPIELVMLSAAMKGLFSVLTNRVMSVE